MRPSLARVLRMSNPARIALILGLVLGAAAPSGAQMFTPPELDCPRSWELIQNLLKRHISFRALNPELRERAIDAYVERIDPSKTLFLSDEVKRLRGRLVGVFFSVQNGECQILDDIQLDLANRYARMEKDVREFVGRPDYELDTDVRLIPSSGGVFEVKVDGDLIFSKKALRRHAEPGEVVRLIRARGG